MSSGPHHASRRVRAGGDAAHRFLAAGRDRAAHAARTGPFSSEMTPAELGLCARLGFKPLVQVMGACVYTIGVTGAPVLGDPGYREYFSRGRGSGSVMFELRRVSAAYNDARRHALARMTEQAACAGAGLVVGVEVRLREQEAADLPILECVATGTAVQVTDGGATASPALTPLSITECWVLRQAGYRPSGLAATTAVYDARPSATTSRALGRRRWRWSAPPNQELPDLSQAVTGAREACQARLADQAGQQDGSGLIAVSLELTHSLGAGLTGERAGGGSPRYANLHLTVHGLGSVIRPITPAATPSDPTVQPSVWLT